MRKMLCGSISIILFMFLGTGCIEKEPMHLASTNPAPESSGGFYQNDTFASASFQLSLPNGWEVSEIPDARLIIISDPNTSNHVTIQVFKENPKSKFIEHMDSTHEREITAGEYAAIELTGDSVSENGETVNHTIIQAYSNWFVFSSANNDENYQEILNSFKLF